MGRGADLSEVPTVEGHAVRPEVFEEVWEDFLLDILRLHTISHTALLHHLRGRGGGRKGKGGREREGEGGRGREREGE